MSNTTPTNYRGPERRSEPPIQKVSLSIGAKVSIVAIVIGILTQLIVTVAFIVTIRVELTALRAEFNHHLVRATVQYSEMEQKLDEVIADFRELKGAYNARNSN